MSKVYRNKRRKNKQNLKETKPKLLSGGSGFSKWLSHKHATKAGLLIIFCIIIFATHWPALSAKALFFDDDLYLTDNLLVQNPGWSSAKQFLVEVLEPSTVHGYYQPLTMISLMLDHAMGGRVDDLMPFHRTSLILHVANTVLIVFLLYQLFGQFWIALGIGLLFGLHPMTVEAIPWVGERKTLLSAFFALCSLNTYVLYCRSSRRRFLVGSLLMYFLAIMSKPISLPLPVLMLLLDYWPLKRLRVKAIFEKSVFFLIAGIFAIITIISQGRTAAITTPAEHGPVRIFLTLCHNIIFYPFKMIWPINLSSYYVFPEPLGLSNPMVLAGVIGTFVLIVLVLVSIRWTPALLTGWLFFMVAIFPTMGVIGFTIVIAADKFAYLPSVGFLMILTFSLVRIRQIWKNSRRLINRLILVIIIILAGVEALATRQNYTYWKDTVSHYKHLLEITPDVVPMLYNLAKGYEREKRTTDAISCYRRILQLDPNYYRAHNNLGVAIKAQGKSNEAIEHYRSAIKIKPDFLEAHVNLGVELQKKGEFDEAIEYFQKALEFKADYAEAHINLGNVLKKIRKFDKATHHYYLALQSKPRDTKLLNNLGNVFSEQGKSEKAIEIFRKVLLLNPDSAIAHSNIGWELKRTSRPNEAIKHFRKSLRLDPKLVPPLFGIATILSSSSNPADIDQAIVFAKQAAKLTNYKDMFILEMLADTYAAAKRFDLALKTLQNALQLATTAKNEPFAKRIRSKMNKYMQATQ